MRRRTLAPALALIAAIIALAGCTPSMFEEAFESVASDWEPQPVKWEACDPDDAAVADIPELDLVAGLVCATLQVPLDYAAPEDGMTTIALSKRAASEPSETTETVLMNPGGPGAGGRSLPLFGSLSLRELGTSHDMVGFDPRGTGASNPIDCLVDAATLTGFEASEKDLTAAIDAQTADRSACIDADGPAIGSMNAETTARDMESIRLAIGEDKVDYLGYSWGTYLGAVFRSLFPDSIDEMVLDSVVPADVDLAGMQSSIAKMGNASLREFAEYIAASPDGAPLGTTPEAVTNTLTDLANALLGKQVTVDDAPYGAALFSDLVFATRSVYPGALTQILAIQAAQDTLTDVQPGTDIVANGVEAAYLCNDAKQTQSAASAWKDISTLRNDFPQTWTATQAYYAGFCVDWPADLSDAPVKLADTGAPLLLAVHPDELVTPGAVAAEMQHLIGGAELTMNDDEHGSTGSASPCGAAAVTEFLQTGTQTTTTCDYDIPAP